MNKEEKQAIEHLKVEREYAWDGDIIEIALNLIDKLKKENKELKEIKQTCYEDIDNIRNEYDKEIEELKEQTKNKDIEIATLLEEDNYSKEQLYKIKDIIEELLGE